MIRRLSSLDNDVLCLILILSRIRTLTRYLGKHRRTAWGGIASLRWCLRRVNGSRHLVHWLRLVNTERTRS
jgi:hypothetical protein